MVLMLGQAYALMPQTYEDVVDMLIPELQRRGIFWDDYCVPGGTYRENFFEKPGQAEPLPSHPAAKLVWKPSTAERPKAQVHFENDTNSKTVEGDFTDWW